LTQSTNGRSVVAKLWRAFLHHLEREAQWRLEISSGEMLVQKFGVKRSHRTATWRRMLTENEAASLLIAHQSLSGPAEE
jgi:hypothetical protein